MCFVLACPFLSASFFSKHADSETQCSEINGKTQRYIECRLIDSESIKFGIIRARGVKASEGSKIETMVSM